MARRKRTKRITRVTARKESYAAAASSLGIELAPVVWVGWQIQRGEKYFGVVQRADGTVEQTRLERDDLQAAADFVTAHKMGNAQSIRGRQLRRLR
jgi:hypothetical protein